jgi:formylglycine-generating enzyme required for sulfatase activity
MIISFCNCVNAQKKITSQVEFRPYVAVVNFKIDNGVKGITGNSMAVNMESVLSDKYRLVDRKHIDAAMTEMRFQESDLVQQDVRSKLKKIIGVDFLITGSVVQTGSGYTVNAKMFEVRTGLIKSIAVISVPTITSLNLDSFLELASMLEMSEVERIKYIKFKIRFPQYLRHGKECLEKKQYANAVSILESAQKIKDSDEVNLLLNQARKALLKSSSETILLANFLRKMRQAQRCMNNKKWNKALEYLRQARKQPGRYYDPEVISMINKAVNGRKQALNQANIQKSNKLFKLADEALKNNQWQNAESLFLRILSIEGYKHNSRALQGLKVARQKSDNQDREQRIQKFKDIMAQGQQALKDKKWKLAESFFRQALSINDFELNKAAETALDIAINGPMSERESNGLKQHTELLKAGDLLMAKGFYKLANIKYIQAGEVAGFEYDKATLIKIKQSRKKITNKLRKEEFERLLEQGKMQSKLFQYANALVAYRKAASIYGYENNPVVNKLISKVTDLLRLQNKRKIFLLKYVTAIKEINTFINNFSQSKASHYEKLAETCHSLNRLDQLKNDSSGELLNKQQLNELKRIEDLILKLRINIKYKLPKDIKAVDDPVIPSLKKLSSNVKFALKRQKNSGLPIEVETKNLHIKLRLIPAGRIMLGRGKNQLGYKGDEKLSEYNVKTPFYVAKYEITQGQWVKVMGGNFLGIGDNPSEFSKVGAKAPVENVSWYDCQKFLDKLCELENVPPGTYRLLKSAEWEYACRAGSRQLFSFGNMLTSNMANFDGRYPYGDTPAGRSISRTVRVGSYIPNAFGLYDMHGNVWEWCQDIYKKDTVSPAEALRIIRGGSWDEIALRCRSALILGVSPNAHKSNLGFRIMRIPLY